MNRQRDALDYAQNFFLAFLLGLLWLGGVTASLYLVKVYGRPWWLPPGIFGAVMGLVVILLWRRFKV